MDENDNKGCRMASSIPTESAYSLSKSDLPELKQNILKSDFKPVQDPLSAALKLRKKRNSLFVDYHSWHISIIDISSLDSL
ncbi:unnamed protein product [Cercopithifilaria johnstoni]|uniref:Uncharacterized protein n=1 Tax=Cercopithifilaria johnstoni TaxID=2874296 RepID=A0A8J2Q449_9BILA|nr:unnamed protein product [Cercopithifilaria johnstoni]